jgi:hypothetical protein
MFPLRLPLFPVTVLCAGLLALCGTAGAQDHPGEVEVHFANGSSVRFKALQDSIDVLTRFGKLTIPLAEVQRIDFGVHLPADVARKVEAGVRKLGSDDYTERDEAGRELSALGASAYPALLKAARSPDQEVSRRAEKALAEVRARLPEKELRSREDDIITTPGFTIVGRILTPGFKAQSEYFGGVQLQLSHLRTLRSIRNPGELQLAVDAAQYGSAHGQWMDTGFDLDGSTSLLIIAAGTVDIYPQSPGQYTSTPKGYGNAALASGAKVPMNPTTLRNHAGALFGRVGDSSEAFYIGERFEGNPGREGKLFLHIVPSPWNNAASGAYQVKITARN